MAVMRGDVGMSERDRVLWTAIRRALMLMVRAIDMYLKEPTAFGKR